MRLPWCGGLGAYLSLYASCTVTLGSDIEIVDGIDERGIDVRREKGIDSEICGCGSPGEVDKCSQSWPRYFRRKADFLSSYRGYNIEVEEIAASNLERFRNEVYLDYGGSGVYQSSQLREHFSDLIENAYGNAHSHNPSAHRTDSRAKEARKYVREFFNASPQDYSVIFTSGSTHAFKIVGENFNWSHDSLFYYLRINHMSVIGMREYTHRHGCIFNAISAEEVESVLKERKKLAVTRGVDMQRMDENRAMISGNRPKCLFAFPAKDNFAGVYYPLGWVKDIQQYGLTDNCDWHVMVDAAAYCATNKLDVSTFPADFVGISFYKLFGYPSGLGVLLLRERAAKSLSKTYFGGGAVVAASCDSHWCKLKEKDSDRWEDGTVSFLAIAAIRYGFQKLYDIGMEKITAHVGGLTRYLAAELVDIRHSNGRPVVHMYGPAVWNLNNPKPSGGGAQETNYGRKESNYETGDLKGEGARGPHGGFLAFNILDRQGNWVPHGIVEKQAGDSHIHLRTGCFCNPGACQDYLGFTSAEVIQINQDRHSCSDNPQNVTPMDPFGTPTTLLRSFYPEKEKPIAAIRVSIGYLTTYNDVEALIQFIRLNFQS